MLEHVEAGDQIKADDHNGLVDAVVDLQHNVFELFLENYFAGKITPYQGLIFDGFSDTAKRDAFSKTLLFAASSGQDKLKFLVGDIASVRIGQQVQAYNGTDQNIRTVIAKLFNQADQYFQDTFTRADAEAVGNSWLESDVFPYTQDFETLALSNLAGQDGWDDAIGSGSSVSVSTDQAYSGTRGVRFQTSGSNRMVQRVFSPVITADGYVARIALRVSATPSTGFGVTFGKDSSNKNYASVYFRSDGKLKGTNGGGTVDLLTYSLNTWYVVDFKFKISTGEVAYQVNGGGFTSYYAKEEASSDPIDRIRVQGENTNGDAYADFIGDGGTANNVDISSNKLRINPSAITTRYIYRAGAFQNAMKIAASVNVVEDSGAGSVSLLSKGDASGLNNGVGVRMNIGSDLLELMDNSTVKASSAFTFTEGNTYNIEVMIFSDYSMEGRAWLSSGSRPSSPTVSFGAFSPSAAGSKWIVGANIAAGTGFEVLIDDYTVSQLNDQLQVDSNLSHSFAIGDPVKTNTVDFDTGNKRIRFAASVGDGKSQIYQVSPVSFQQAMESAHLWVSRNWTARYNLAAGISGGATTLTIAGDHTAQFKSGDTVDIYSSNNLLRERVVLTINSTFGGGNTTLTWSGGLTNAFGTTAYAERVDVLPRISIVNVDGDFSYENLTYVQSIVDFANSEVEDEYAYTPASPNEDAEVELVLTRQDTALTPYAKKLGVALNT